MLPHQPQRGETTPARLSVTFLTLPRTRDSGNRLNLGEIRWLNRGGPEAPERATISAHWGTTRYGATASLSEIDRRILITVQPNTVPAPRIRTPTPN
jgi:hypothetical protein